jgi:ABC-type Fe3+-hydroxamate transport system substrate-binding protein
MITYQHFSVLIDPEATESYISSVALKIIKVKAVKQDAYRYVEMASGAKKKVGGKVKDFNINLGDFFKNVNLYVTILVSYDIVIGMDWLESNDAILNYRTK